MPLYEYLCSECKRNFELIKQYEEDAESCFCPHCGGKSQRLISSFSFKNQKRLAQRHRESAEEKMYNAERRLEEDKTLDPNKWLDRVRNERLAEKKFKQEAEQVYGKESDSVAKYKSAIENVERIQREDPLNSD